MNNPSRASVLCVSSVVSFLLLTLGMKMMSDGVHASRESVGRGLVLTGVGCVMLAGAMILFFFFVLDLPLLYPH